MKRVFKYMCYCIPIALLALGCKADEVSEFEPSYGTTGEVTFVASIENAASRASLIKTGEARWLKDDAISVVCDDNSTVDFALDGTGETRKAFFKGVIPEGKTVGDYAIYPTSATYKNGVVEYNLPSEIAPSATGGCSLMVAETGESVNIEFKQLMAYLAVQFSNVSENTAKIVISSDNNLSGKVTAKLPAVLTEGVAATAGNNTVAVVIEGKAPATVDAVFAVPVGDYTSLKAEAYDAKDVKLSEVTIATGIVSATRGLLLEFKAKMADYEMPKIEGTVCVAGIYWATGNLQYLKDGAAVEGYQQGWRIAPSQAHYLHYDTQEGGKKTDLTSYDVADHFNFGGIADPFSPLVTAPVETAAGVDISAKMYLDQVCASVTTDFAAAQYGDIAYWATNGIFRMPTQDEFKLLTEKASSKIGEYTLGGKAIKGMYFYDPAAGEEPTHDTELTHALTDADLAVGLFLPYAGRGYNAESTQFGIYNFGSQGVYRSSTTLTPESDATAPCYGAVFAVQNVGGTKKTYDYWNKAFDAKGRYSIRPIYTGNGTIPTPPSTPDPTPTPDPDPTPEPDPTPTPDPDPTPTPTPNPEGWGAGTPGGEIGENPYAGEL